MISQAQQNKTIKDGFKEFITSCKVKNLSNATIVYYTMYMGKFEVFLNQHEIECIKEINLPVINSYILYLRDFGNVNDTTINTSIRAVRAIVYYFQELGYCQPFKVNLIKANKEIKETYTEHELMLLLEKPNTARFTEYRDWVMVNFLLATGVRVGEIVGIRIKDVDFDDAIVKIKRGKSRRERHIPLSKTLIKILNEYIQIRQYSETNDYLFCNCYGQKMIENSCKCAISKYNRRRGVNKTSIHLFRHTFAKMFILNGGDIFRLQKILGHKSIDIVREYVNMFTNDLKENFDDFNPLENINKGKGDYITIKKGKTK